MQDLQDHKLTEKENERIFNEDVKPYLMAISGKELKPSAEPVMVIVGGQPGAGKSRSIDSVRMDLDRQGGALEIAADDLRKFHPKNDELMQKDDRTAANYTHADATIWAEKAERFARQERYNVLLEGTLKTPENAANKLAEYKKAGYFVEVRVIAVREETSWQGVVERYEQQKAHAGAGRMTPKEVHDTATSGVLASVEKIESEKLADRVRVDRRGAEEIYSNSLVGPETTKDWSKPPAARQAIEDERSRPLTLAESRDRMISLDTVEALQARPGRNASDVEVLVVATLRAAALKEHEQVITRDQNLNAAEIFRQQNKTVGVEMNPKLLGAYSQLDNVEHQAKTHGINRDQIPLVQNILREKIASQIEKGNYPQAAVREAKISTERVPREPELER